MTATARTSAEQPRTAEDLVARLGDTVAEHGDEIHELRAAVSAMRIELADLRHELATEVRTHRLVVLGPDDSERIITTCNDRMSSLVVQVQAPEASAKWELRPKAELSVSDGDSMTDDGGEEVAKASLDLMTGDDSYNLIEQTASESRDGHTLTERGSIEAFQQRTTRGHDNKPMTADRRIMRLDQRGITETGPGNRVEAYSPLIRLPQ